MKPEKFLRLSSFTFATYDSHDIDATERTVSAIADSSVVVPVGPEADTFAVRMTFVVKTDQFVWPLPGIRRKVGVTLTYLNSPEDCITLEFNLYIPAGCTGRQHEVTLSISADEVDPSKLYVLRVDDLTDGGMINFADVRFTDDVEDKKEKDEFERMLDDFISSCKRDSLADPEADPETDSETDAEETQEPLEVSASLLKPMDHLVGLTAVKEKLTAYETLVRFNSMRARHGFSYASAPLHAMFLGSPGTGKTTVANMMGEMLVRAGVLSKGHVVVRQRATLLGPNYSEEETKTLKAIEEAQGGILFIDEAYQLFQPDDPRDPGRFVIETLLTALADESRRDWMLILAGYTDRMLRMFDMNPGLRSRIPDSNIYVFDDFSEPELMQIAEGYLSRNSFTLTPGARAALEERIAADYGRRDAGFGNARYVGNLIETEIIPAMAARVCSQKVDTIDCLTLIQASDIPGAVPVPAARPLHPRIGFRA